MARMTREMYRRKRREQRLMGLVLLILCGVILWVCSTGKTVEDQDAGVAFLLAPMGIHLLITKRIDIY